MVEESVSRELQSPASPGRLPPPRIILGSGRSGTTWILDCLAEANRLRPAFEPLHQNESLIGSRYAYEVLTEADSAGDLEQYLNEIVAGRIHSRWIDYRAPRRLVFPHPSYFLDRDKTMRWLSGWRKYLRRRKALKESVNRSEVLIKCIRANLMADWFSRRLGCRVAMIVRHPCSVVESQLRLGHTWDPAPVRARYRGNQRLHELTNGRYADLLNQEHTVVEALALNWVVENQWSIEQRRQGGYEVFFYEDLLAGGVANWARLCESLGLLRVPDAELLERPSQQSDPMTAQNRQEFRVPSWRNKIREDQLGEIQGVLDATGFTIYNVESDRPCGFESRP